jgi:hypothetical protein
MDQQRNSEVVHLWGLKDDIRIVRNG